MASSEDLQRKTPLYSAVERIYPKGVKGTFRNIKWALQIILLGVYYLVPFIRWDRGLDAPDQAVLVDIPGRRMYFFFIEIWPQEVYYLTGLLILASLALFLMNAIAGRLWCGYLCPQTVWTDLYQLVERWVEGDRRERMKLDKSALGFNRIIKKITKHFLWVAIAAATGGAWVLYFTDAPTVIIEIFTGDASFDVYVWIAILTGTTYLLAGEAREQVCIYMCPWPRIQAALTDIDALNVTYRYDRGEPRMSLKKQNKALKDGNPVGDCVDCNQCFYVCPTGVDIRHGLQLACIQCGLCIDACDDIMKKINKPTGLIGYDTDINVERRSQGLPEEHIHWFRPRTIIYMVLISIVSAIMLYTYNSRSNIDISVLHDRNPHYVMLSAGGIRNGYTIRLLNKTLEQKEFLLEFEAFKDSRMEIVGVEPNDKGDFYVTVRPDSTREIRVLLFATPEMAKELEQTTDILFRITDLTTAETSYAYDFFKSRRK